MSVYNNKFIGIRHRVGVWRDSCAHHQRGWLPLCRHHPAAAAAASAALHRRAAVPRVARRRHAHWRRAATSHTTRKQGRRQEVFQGWGRYYVHHVFTGFTGHGDGSS